MRTLSFRIPSHLKFPSHFNSFHNSQCHPPGDSQRGHSQKRMGGKCYGVLLILASLYAAGIGTVAVAQPPGKILDRTQLPPLQPEQRVAANKTLGAIRMAERIASPVRLRVTDASLQDIAAKMKGELVPSPLIEVRHLTAARFSLDLQDMPAGQILHSVATLAGCKLFVLSDRLLLAPTDQLAEGERAEAKDWKETYLARGTDNKVAIGEARTSVNKVIINWFQGLEPAGNRPVGTSSGQDNNVLQVRLMDMSPELQRLVQTSVTLAARMSTRPVRAPLSGDTVISFSTATNPGKFTLSIKSLSQGQGDISIYDPAFIAGP